jgi:AcrR family transcriptional regulator
MMASRTERADATREQILVAAERLFAEHGLSVSNRQIGEAAGQGNNFAVGYHFGTKTDLIRAIMNRHNEPIDQSRQRMLTAAEGSAADVRDWIACLVRPFTRHLAGLGRSSWFARFAAQVMTDPTLRAVFVDEGLNRPSIQRVLDGLGRCIPALPEEVRHERADMARILIQHVCAERERALANGTGTARASWEDAATGLIDALAGLWLAPVTATTMGKHTP